MPIRKSTSSVDSFSISFFFWREILFLCYSLSMKPSALFLSSFHTNFLSPFVGILSYILSSNFFMWMFFFAFSENLSVRFYNGWHTMFVYVPGCTIRIFVSRAWFVSTRIRLHARSSAQLFSIQSSSSQDHSNRADVLHSSTFLPFVSDE